MPSEQVDSNQPSPEDAMKRTDIDKIEQDLRSRLESEEYRDLSTQERIEKFIRIITDADSDSSAFTDEKDMNDLCRELRSYTGRDLGRFFAERITAMFGREGKYSDEAQFREKIAARNNERRGFLMFPDNSVFSYGFDDEGRRAHIHLTNPYSRNPSEELTGTAGAAVLRQFLKGLDRFAKDVVGPRTDIETITATSMLLDRPEFSAFLERLGFRNQGEIDEELRRKYFSDDKGPVIRMSADREPFLAHMKDADARTMHREFIKILRKIKEKGRKTEIG
jgi:hypothetical protein